MDAPAAAGVNQPAAAAAATGGPTSASQNNQPEAPLPSTSAPEVGRQQYLRTHAAWRRPIEEALEAALHTRKRPLP